MGWTALCNYEVVFANRRSPLLASFKSGEMLMCKFRGPGTVYIQSRNPEAFRGWLATQVTPNGANANAGGKVVMCCFLIVFFSVALLIMGTVLFAFLSGSGSVNFEDEPTRQSLPTRSSSSSSSSSSHYRSSGYSKRYGSR